MNKDDQTISNVRTCHIIIIVISYYILLYHNISYHIIIYITWIVMNLLSLSLWHSWHCRRCCSLSESDVFDWHDLQGCKWTANHSSENRILKNKSNIAWILLFLGFGNCNLGNFHCWSWKLVLVCPFTKRKDFDPWFWQWLVCFSGIAVAICHTGWQKLTYRLPCLHSCSAHC